MVKSPWSLNSQLIHSTSRHKQLKLLFGFSFGLMSGPSSFLHSPLDTVAHKIVGKQCHHRLPIRWFYSVALWVSQLIDVNLAVGTHIHAHPQTTPPPPSQDDLPKSQVPMSRRHPPGGTTLTGLRRLCGLDWREQTHQTRATRPKLNLSIEFG